MGGSPPGTLMPRARKSPAPKRIYVRMTRWRLKRFFTALAECGTVRVAAELAGLGIGAIYRLRKAEPGFAEEMAAAKAKAAMRLAAQADADRDYAGLVVRRGAGGRLQLM